MEIRQLRHFIAAAEAGNIRKASEKIHISRPAISMSIKNLEQDLGVALLYKNRQGVQTTYAGEQFLKSAHSILRQLDDIKASLQGTQDSPTGNVRLGVPYGINNALAAPLFEFLTSQLPGINLEIEEGNSNSLNRLYEGGLIDLMISYDFVEKMDQKCEQLYREHLYFVSAYDPSLDGVDDIEIIELAKYPIVCSPGKTSMRTTLEKYALDNNVEFNFMSDFQSAHASLKIVESKLADTISSWDEIYDHVVSKRVSARRIVNPEVARTICLISSLRKSHSFAVIAVINAIKVCFEQAISDDRIRVVPFAS